MRRIFMVLLTLALVATPAFSNDARTEKAKRDFGNKKYKLLLDAGQEHLELGVWAREKGLVGQATAHIIKAVEVSDGKNPGAQKVLQLMQRFGEDFFRRNLKNPSSARLKAYEKKALAVRKGTQRDWLTLAAWALKKDLEDEAFEIYRKVIIDTGEPIEVDDDGRVELESATLAEPVSKRLIDAAVSINDRLYVRDDFLEKLPELEAIQQVENETLRVRTPLGMEVAEDLLALGTALVPLLTERVGGRPTRRMDLFVFPDSRSWRTYLKASEMEDRASAAGLAISSSFVALVDAAGGIDKERMRAVALHELSHLFMYGITRSIMPSWYSEGFAEQWGGSGTFTWEDGELTIGGELSSRRMKQLATDMGFIPIRTLIKGNALKLIQTDQGGAARFYAESWALYRYLSAGESGAGKDIAERFALYETMCRGKGLGSKIGDPDSRDTAPSAQLFEQMFASDFDEIETGFRAWLGEF